MSDKFTKALMKPGDTKQYLFGDLPDKLDLMVQDIHRRYNNTGDKAEEKKLLEDAIVLLKVKGIIEVQIDRNEYPSIHEMCHHCETEVELDEAFEPQVCSECGVIIMPCSICEKRDCSKCPLEKIKL